MTWVRISALPSEKAEGGPCILAYATSHQALELLHLRLWCMFFMNTQGFTSTFLYCLAGVVEVAFVDVVAVVVVVDDDDLDVAFPSDLPSKQEA